MEKLLQLRQPTNHPTCTPRSSSQHSFTTESIIFISSRRLYIYHRAPIHTPPSCRAITRTSLVDCDQREAQTDKNTVIWSCAARRQESPSAASATNATASVPYATVTSAPQPSSASATNAPLATTRTNALSAVARYASPLLSVPQSYHSHKLSGNLRRLLLLRMHPSGKGQRWLPQDYKSG
jgi:hypothetical protein